MGILLTLSYDGTNYCGWQIQKNGVTVQKILEDALTELYHKDVKVLGASRTDSGVHALGQRAHFKAISTIPLHKLPLAINSKLPEDIVVTKAETVSDDFNPIAMAKRKTYEYKILNSPFQNPKIRNYSYFVRQKLDVGRMVFASKHFLGQHDFAAFCATGSEVSSTIRTIFSFNINVKGDTIDFIICGDGFLYNMVRIIAGTMVDVGISKIEPDYIKEIIESKDRNSAGKTAPPQALTLINVEY